MSLRLRMSNGYRSLTFAALIAGLTVLPAPAQTTISTGSIQGTVTDQSGAVLQAANVIVTNRGTGQTSSVTTTSSGTYNSGALIPGDYKIRIAAKGFKTVEGQITVQVGVTSSGNFKLDVGDEAQ